MTSQPPAATTQPSHSAGAVDDLSIVYPSSDGEPMAASDLQYVPLTETVSTLRIHFIDRSDVYVAGDMLVYYRMNDNTASVAPDVFAVFGAAGNHPRDSWLVWREGRAPDFVMEMASESTWERDVGEKRDIYAAMGVREYWRFDPTGACFTPALVGERLEEGEYQGIEVAPEPSGRLVGSSAVLGLDLCVEPGLELRLYDPDTGQRLRNHREDAAEVRREASARQAAEAEVRREMAARQAAEAEVRRLREQLRDLQSRG